MTTTNQPLPNDLIFAGGPYPGVFVDAWQITPTTGLVVGTPGRQPAIIATITGRRNNSGGQPDDVTIALSPQDALQLLNDLLHSLEAISAHHTDNEPS
jgi:hypothetical protein